MNTMQVLQSMLEDQEPVRRTSPIRSWRTRSRSTTTARRTTSAWWCSRSQP
ncbi:MAG: hypothetical protein M0C28_34460 [Candidatus Moduliflexus flocculans]|nr:hypothetical protein [Candidatus Moduliflexus flocculans]